jgi:murein DD-endopeptidase MepM/ murein hydrolase activator NlpD
MNLWRKILYCILLLKLSSLDCSSQSVPYIIDTISIDTRKVLIYSNQTWSYLYCQDSDSNIFCLDTTNLFTSHWTSKQIFAYLGEPQNNERYEIDFPDTSNYFMLPIYGRLFRGFGRGHDGLDISLKKGDSVKVAFDGKVRYATYNRGGYGNLVIVRHFNGLETYYAHLSKLIVRPDQTVKAGDIIGLGGSTGRSFAPHLHFEVRYRDKPLDPLRFIDFEQKQLVAGYKLIVNNNKREPRALKKDTYHRIKRGESLQKIAKIYGVTVKHLCAINNLSPKAKLKKGSKIKVL